MHRPRSIAARSAAVLIALVALVAVSMTAGTASTAPADPYASLTGSVQVGYVLYGLNNATDTGALNPLQTLTIGVMLSRPDPAAELAYIHDVYDPSSPDYRHFLTAAEYAQRFGVAEQRFEQLVSWLQGAGLQVTTTQGDTDYVLAQGTVAAIDALLDIQIQTYTFEGTSFFANPTRATVPADLGVLAIPGLENLVQMQSDQQLQRESGIPTSLPAKGSVTGKQIGPDTNIGTTTPQDLWSIYDQPSDNMGQGESMAIFGDGCVEPSDNPACAGVDLIGNLRSDEQTYDLPAIPIYYQQYGTAAERADITDTTGTGEFELDLPASTGMAPLADFERLYFGANGDDPDMLDAFTAWNNDPDAPRQGSWSYGGCEATPFTGSLPGGPENPPTGPAGTLIGNPNQDAYEALFEETVGLGHTLFNAVGDTGGNSCPAASLAANGVTPVPTQINGYPDSSAWVVTVGGTILYWNGDGDSGSDPATRALEYVWPYSGGGTSCCIAAQSYQTTANGDFNTNVTSVPGLVEPCLFDWHNPPNAYPVGTLCRGQPDVSAQSGDGITNGYFAGAGTSLSSPLWLGMWTRIQAAAPLTTVENGGLGFANYAIYAAEASPANYASDFFDIGQAGNDETIPSCELPCDEPQFNETHNGWDYATGWGVPDVANLMNTLDGGTAPTHALATDTPEAPWAALLALAGVLIALPMLRRRRRTRR